MYFITMLENKNDDGRCVGYYNTFDRAEQVVKENEYDICEYIYKYAVIEEIGEGVYMCPTKEYWYQYNSEDEIYEECEKPECFRDFTGFGIG